MKLIHIGLGILSCGAMSCIVVEEEGPEPRVGNGSRGDTRVADRTVETSSECGVDEPLGNVVEDTVLVAGGCFEVEGTIRVQNGARLTIEAGVVLEFGLDAALEVESSGSIIALGTAENSIQFRGLVDEVGYWRSLNILSNNPENELGYVEFMNGGSEITCCAVGRETAMVLVESGGRVSIHDSSFELSGNNGLGVEVGGSLSLFEFNSFYENDGAPVRIAINEVGSLDSNSDYAGEGAAPHGDNYIEVRGANFNDDSVWPGVNLPFRSHVGVDVGGGTLTLAAGTTFEFDVDEGLEVSDGGTLIAVGTVDEPIVFTGASGDSDNWKGLLFASSSPENILSNVEIFGGGADEWCCVVGGAPASLIVRNNSRLEFSDSRITASHSTGLRIRAGSRLETFARNVFFGGADTPILAAASELYRLDSASTFAESGEDISVEVAGNVTTADGVWAALDVPYLFLNDDTAIQSDIVVEPGAHFTFASDAGLWVDPEGSFYADAEGGVITFEGASDKAGFWKGLAFESDSTDNVLNDVIIDGAGSEEWCCAVGREAAAVLVEPNGSVSLTNSIVSGSAGWGVLARVGYGLLEESGNSYTDVVSGEISLPN